jgi:hypothetical protein
MRRVCSRYAFVAITLLVSVGVADCTYSEPRIRPEPALYFDYRANSIALSEKINALPQGNELKTELSARCAEYNSSFYTYTSGALADILTGTTGPRRQCVYITVDADSVANLASKADQDPQLEKSVVYTLLDVSDYDCANFLASAFAFRTGATFFQKLVSTTLSGTSAVTAFASATATSGLSIGNAVLGSAVSQMSSEYYADQTFNAMETAITGAASRTHGHQEKTACLGSRAKRQTPNSRGQ